MKKRILKVISIVVVLLFILLGYYFLNYHFGFSIPCFFYELTGFYCPTCGITRMLFALLNFDFIKAFNYKNIYKSDRVKAPTRYFSILLNEIYYTLKNTYDGKNTLGKIREMKKVYPEVFESFEQWLSRYWDLYRKDTYFNDVLFNIEDERDFCQAIIYYISGMTDNFAIDTYNKIVSF